MGGWASLPVSPVYELSTFMLATHEVLDPCWPPALNLLACVHNNTHAEPVCPVMRTSSLKFLHDGTAQIQKLGDDPVSNVDVLNFGSVEYTHEEGSSPACEVIVTRRGPGLSDVSVDWSNENSTVAPNLFEELSGTVLIKAGETQAAFDFPIADNSDWNLAARQKIHLANPVAVNLDLTGADPGVPVILGELSTTQVVTSNDDTFPNGVEMSKAKFTTVIHFFLHLYNEFRSEAHMAFLLRIYTPAHWVCTSLMVSLTLRLGLELGLGVVGFALSRWGSLRPDCTHRITTMCNAWGVHGPRVDPNTYMLSWAHRCC